MKKVQKLTLMILMMMLVFSGCEQLTAPSVSQPETGVDHGNAKIVEEDGGPSQGGIINLFMITPDTLNPLTTRNQTVRQMASFVFDTLFMEDSEGRVKDGLVDRYTLSDDGLILDITLKDNVYFHDGQALSAEDVAFSVGLIQSAGNRSFYYDYVKGIESVKIITRLGLRIVLSKADTEILNKLTFPIVPQHVFENWPMEGHSDSLTLIGSGPFVYKSYQDNAIILERNNAWWYVDAPNGLGHPIWLDGIVFKVYPDESYMMEAFHKKEIDIASDEITYMEGFSQRTDIYFKPYEGNTLEFLALSPVGKDNSPIAQVDFRQILIDYLWGYDDLIPSQLGKLVIPEGTSEMGSSRGATLAALTEAGFTYDQEKNVLTYQKNGIRIPVTLTLRYNNVSDERKGIGQRMANALFEIGITLKVEAGTQAELQTLAASGRYDMMLMGCRIPEYTDVSGALKVVREALGMGEKAFTIMPLYRKYSAVLYQKTLRGLREPTWKNIYNGWTEWYLMQN
jgi:peptide/nickel transport system substrate-binding protein